MNDEDVPKSLKMAYEEAFAKGHYRGTLPEWVSVKYMLFRLSVKDSGREPASRRAWLQHMLDYERMCDEGNK